HAGHARARVLADGGHQRRQPGGPVDRGVAARRPRGRGRLAARDGRRDPRRRPLRAAHRREAGRRREGRRHHRRPRGEHARGDDVRWVLTKGKLPAAEWIDVITTAHRVGIPTTATMMYGHVDNHLHWVRHIKLIRRLQEETGGFSEFVLLPFVHTSAPIYLAGVARPGPTAPENRAVHARARILLPGPIRNIQWSGVKLQDELCRQVLQGGVNDLGGTLMEETISRMAGSENGSYKTISELRAMVEPTGRPVRQRTTEYGTPSEERLAASAASDGVCQSVRRLLPTLDITSSS